MSTTNTERDYQDSYMSKSEPVLGYSNYKGLLIRQLIGGIEWNGKKFLSTNDLDDYIRQTDQIINNNKKNRPPQE